MRSLLIFLPILGVVIAIEALFRWSNGLEMGWSWVAYRTGILAIAALASALFSRSDARRIRRTGLSNRSIWTPIFLLLFGGVGFVVWTWRVIEALLTGQVIVSTSPEVYTAWSANPAGFLVAMGFGVLGTLFFLLLFVGGIFFMWDYIRSRHGPAWP